MALGQAQHTLWGNNIEPHATTMRRLQPCTLQKLTRTDAAQNQGLSPMNIVAVFVFTLDCNNRIYCYDTEDVTMQQPTG